MELQWAEVEETPPISCEWAHFLLNQTIRSSENKFIESFLLPHMNDI